MQLQLPSGDITRDFMQKLVDTVNELTEARAKIATLETELAETKKAATEEPAIKRSGSRDPQEADWHQFVYPDVTIAEITEAGTGGDAGKYKVKEKYVSGGVLVDYVGGRVLTSYASASSHAKEVNGRSDIPVGDIVQMFAKEDTTGYSYVIGPFFSTGGGGGGGGLLVQLYTCEDVEEYGSVSCAIDASPLEAAVSTLAFSSGCQVGDVRWTGSDASEIKGVVWTLGVKADAGQWDHTVNEDTVVPTTTLYFKKSADGEYSEDVIELNLKKSNETRSTNGAWCGGQIVTVWGLIPGGNGIEVIYDQTTPGDGLESMTPVKKIHFSDRANTSSPKSIGIKYEMTENPGGADRRIKAEAFAEAALNDLTDVDLDAAQTFAGDNEDDVVFYWNSVTQKWQRGHIVEQEVVVDVLWDDDAGQLQQKKETLRVLHKTATGTYDPIETAVNCVVP
jgi:hypothetical protein